MPLEMLLGSVGTKTFFSVFDRGRKNRPDENHGRIGPDLDTAVRSGSVGRILVRDGAESDQFFDSLEKLVPRHRYLLESSNRLLFCKILLALNFGPNYRPIEDPLAYRRNLEQMAESLGPSYDLDLLAEPKMDGGRLVFFAHDMARSIPVRVVVDAPAEPGMVIQILLLEEKTDA